MKKTTNISKYEYDITLNIVAMCPKSFFWLFKHGEPVTTVPSSSIRHLFGNKNCKDQAKDLDAVEVTMKRSLLTPKLRANDNFNTSRHPEQDVACTHPDHLMFPDSDTSVRREVVIFLQQAARSGPQTTSLGDPSTPTNSAIPNRCT